MHRLTPLTAALALALAAAPAAGAGLALPTIAGPSAGGSGADMCHGPFHLVTPVDCTDGIDLVFDGLGDVAEVVDVLLCTLGLPCDAAATLVAELKDCVSLVLDTIESAMVPPC